jgi:curved DNA-binding protein CbpA
MLRIKSQKLTNIGNKFFSKIKTHYQILEVSSSASTLEIKHAFKKKAKQCHPDQFPDRETIFREVNDAYQILSDPESRKQYDIQIQPKPTNYSKAKEYTGYSTNSTSENVWVHLDRNNFAEMR